MLVKGSLQVRIVALAATGTLVVLAFLGTLSKLAVDESVHRTLQERLNLAGATAQQVDYVLKQNLDLLQAAAFSQGIDTEDTDVEPERRALHDVYFRTIFKDAVYILDEEGRQVWKEPPLTEGPTDLSNYAHVREALESGRPVVSDIYMMELTMRPVVSIVIPMKNGEGKLVGLIGGDVDVTASSLQQIIQPIGLGPSAYVQIVDGKGVVIAGSAKTDVLKESDHSNRLATLIQQKRPVVSACHDCHSSAASQATRDDEIMAFVPLQTASWGLVVREPEQEALAPARRLQQQFLLFGLPVFLISVALAWGTAQSVIRPVGVLTRAAERIANGNLTDRIPYLGEDEIGTLALTFDVMRARLKQSHDSLQRLTGELEKRVERRTQELRESQLQLVQRNEELSRLYSEVLQKEEMRTDLLHKVISAQEDERKRIARELHDETSQSLAALVMALEAIARTPCDSKTDVTARIEGVKALGVRTLEEIHKLIFDLRPSLLDDLGLIPAIKWYAESRLQAEGVKVHLETCGDERRLPPEVETALFRAVQEAITNIAKHARAENVAVSLDFDDAGVAVEIEDDGDGFDVLAVSGSARKDGTFGLMGMRERVSLLGGKLEISSEPGSGTKIRIVVPSEVSGLSGVLGVRSDNHAKNKGPSS